MSASRSFWVREPGRGEVRTREAPVPGPGEVLVHALYSGVSRGTESLVFRGEVPSSQRSAMRAPFQEGDFPGPVKYGYSNVGRVAAVGGEAEHLEDLVGRTVFCLHPHEDVYAVDGRAVLPLPDDLPPERAVLAANMETAVNVVWDAGPSVGDRVTVVGAGVVGLLGAFLCAAVPGTRVTAVDPRKASREAAELLGAEAEREVSDGAADVVIHASGSPEGLSAALGAAGPEATVVEASWFGSRSVGAPLGEAFHSRRLRLRSSQVGGVPPERRPRWTPRRRLALALEVLRDPRLDRLVNSEGSLEELPRVLEGLSRDPGDVLCHRVRY